MLANNKNSYKFSIDFRSLVKKYWKENIILYVLATLSCFGSSLVLENTLFFIRKIKNNGEKINYFWTVLGGSFEIKNFGNDEKKFFIFTSSLIFFYFLIVFSHVWFSFYLRNKLKMNLKESISRKMFDLKKHFDQKKYVSLLNYNIELFSESIFFIPNQLYYLFVQSLILCLTYLAKNTKKKFSYGSGSLIKIVIAYFFFFSFLCLTLQYASYKEELSFQKTIRSINERELFLINNRDLIIKKNFYSSSLNSYNESLKKVFYKSSLRDFVYSLSFVFPPYFLLRWFPLIVIYFLGNSFDKFITESVMQFCLFFDNLKKIVERCKYYPLCISSQKEISDFLNEEERNDIQNNLSFIGKKVFKISFEKVVFFYDDSDNNPILKDLSIQFEIGKINRMKFPNGFGKSTIVNILMGLIKVKEGRVLINNNYLLSDINFKDWREVIGYSEHKNLIIEDNLSTGQKQLIELKNLLDDENKQIYIFDEADSNLDVEKRNEFFEKIEKLSKNKLVILITHFD